MGFNQPDFPASGLSQHRRGPPVDIYLNGTMVASGLADDPSSPQSVSAFAPIGSVTIAVIETGAPAGQVLTLQHGVVAAGDLVDVFVVGSSTAHPSTIGLITDAVQLGAGYRLYASDGGVFDFGVANFYSSMGGLPLNGPIAGAAPTSDGNGYWLEGADGGVFCLGDAAFSGSAANLQLNEPIVGMAPYPGGAGYWLVSSEGGVFSSGDAPFVRFGRQRSPERADCCRRRAGGDTSQLIVGIRCWSP